MPTPKDGESQADFVSRCIPIVMKEGTAKDNKQGAAICHSMWREHHKKKRDDAELLEYRTFEIRASTLNKEDRSVECLISSESPVAMFDWERGEPIDEILLTDGAVLPRSRQVPLLNTHMRNSLDDVLGSARGLKKTDEGVVGRLQFSSLSSQQFTRVEEGHITDISAGYRVEEKQFVPRGEKHKIGNRFFTGPVNVVTRWRLKEASLVPIGADEQAKLREFSTENAPVDPESQNRTGDLTMSKELRALLVSRGMPDDLDDANAMKWLEEHRAEVISQKPAPSPPPDPDPPDPEITRSNGNGAATRKEELESVVRNIIQIDQERKAKFRTEIDALLDISGFKSDAALAERCYQLPDLPAVRAEIIKHRQANTVDVGSALQFRAGDHAAVEKFNGCMGTALLMRCANHDEKMIERAHNEELRWGRPVAFGKPETWAQRKQRSAGWEQYQSLSMLGLASECLRFEGVDTRYLAPWQIAQAALGYHREAGVRSAFWDSPMSVRNPGSPAYHTTGSFANLTLDAMNKSMLMGYVERAFTWEGPMRRAPSAKDFKKIYRVRLGEFPNLEATPDNTAPNQASFADEKESYAVEAYSKEISYSWQLLVNDDMDALSRTPRMMGVAASRTVNTFAWTFVETNAVLQDGQAWFSAATGNRKKSNLIASGSGAPSLVRLNEMRKLMRLQVGVNTPEATASEAILNLEPAYWIVPAALELVARQLLFSPFSPDATNSITFNQFNQGNSSLQLVVEPLLDAQTNGATASMLFCSPSQCDTAEIAFLQGQETPFTRSYMDDPTMAMKWQIWQTFGGKPIDFRGVVRDKGIA